MKLKLYVFLIINFFLSSLTFASNPPLPDPSYPHINIIFDQETGTLRLRWTDDLNQFLSITHLPDNPELCHHLTHKHFEEIRNEMRLRIQRTTKLGLEPLNDQLFPRQQMVTALNPLPSVDSILKSIPSESLVKKKAFENQNDQLPAPLTKHLHTILKNVQPDSSSLSVHEYKPNDSAPFRQARAEIDSRISKKRVPHEMVWRANKVKKFTDYSELG